MELGRKIRMIRESEGFSIKDLATELNVSSSHISQVERNISSPSITMLKKMANIFNIPMTSFFDDEVIKEGTIIKKEKRNKMKLPDSNFTYEMLSPSTVKDFQLLMTKIEEGGQLGDNPIGHKGQECCYISKGKVQFIIRDKEHTLIEGDSIYYPENTPHNVLNIGEGEAIIISVISPADF